VSKEFEKELFDETEAFFSSRGTEVFYDEIEGKNVLVMEYGDDGSPVPADCTVSVIEPDEGCTAVNIMFTLLPGPAAGASDDIEILLPLLNKYLTIGSFGFINETGYLYFSCSFIVDENEEIINTMKLFLSTWEAAFDTSREGLEILLPVINGDVPAGSLTEDEATIIQF